MASAQMPNAPIRIAKAPQAPLPDAQQLLDNLFAPYQAARTFRGNFDIDIKAANNAIAEIHLDSRFRYDDKGNLNGQFDTLRVVGRAKPRERQTFVFVGENQNQKLVLVEQKAWWVPAQRENSPALATFIQPIVEGVVAALENDDDFVPVVARSIEAGQAVLVLKAKKGNIFRAVIDEQTRALLSFEVKNSVSIRGSNQRFNAPIADADLSWSAPADYRQVAPGEVAPPASLGISLPGENAPLI